MKKILALGIILCLFASVNAQTETKPDTVYKTVQQQPRFPGDINKWLGENIKYPEGAKKNNIQGTVYVTFIVEKDGSISTVKSVKGVEGGDELNQEAARVLSAMPNWKPGIQNGKNVRVQYMVPVRFVLNDDKETDKKGN